MTLTKATYSLVSGAPLNVLDYGADPTGAADSTAAIQAAIDAALSAGASGTVWVPTGTYKVTSVNIYPTGNKSLVLVGDGPYNTLFAKNVSGGTTPVFNISGTAGGGGGAGVASKCQFKNFAISGAAKTVTGMYIDTLAHFFMEGVFIYACDIALRSLGSLIFACRSCNFSSNNIGFQADQSPVNNGYSNLIRFSDCVFQGNTTNHARLNKGAQITFDSCDCEAGGVNSGVVFYIASTYEDETTISNVTWNNCWWEGNYGNPIVSDSNNTWITLRNCSLYGPASAVTINGSNNSVTTENCLGTEGLTITDVAATVNIINCQFPSYSIASPNATITNLRSSGATVLTRTPQINSTSGQIATTTGTPVVVGTTGANIATLVLAYVSTGSVNETCSGIVIEGNISNNSPGTNMSLSVSGTDIRVTQTTGGPLTIRYATLRLL